MSKMKVVGLVFALFLAFIFLPVIPVEMALNEQSNSIPVDGNKTDLNGGELIKVINIARGGPLITGFSYFFGYSRDPVIYIAPADDGVEVNLGYICGEECGQGIKIKVIRIEGQWTFDSGNIWWYERT